jgi:predicted DNA-binding transcriptional regulator AlpA
MELLGYSPTRRSAFWQFVHSNHAPLIRVGRKKIMFSEQAVRDWLARRSSTGEA